MIAGRRWVRFGVPLLVVIGASAIAAAMIAAKPEVETRPAEPFIPLVRFITARPSSADVTVRSQGTVKPRTESALVPEITGRVTYVSPALASGGFFDAGDVLLRLERRDHELAVIAARAQVAQAAARLRIEEEEAAVARREWAALGKGDPAPLVVRVPQLAEARAAHDAAAAALERAERDLARTTIHAPFSGRVREKRVDVGQVVASGNPVATLYATDAVEISLPVPDEELAFLDLPLVGVGSGAKVTLHALFAGQQIAWSGRVVRTEGSIDTASRMVHLIAEVRDPYGRRGTRTPAPLAVGLFVRADIHGRTLRNVFAIPREAMRADDEVLVIDADDRLRSRRVRVVRREREHVFVDQGLTAGERVCVSPLDVAVDGMKVRAIVDDRRVGS